MLRCFHLVCLALTAVCAPTRCTAEHHIHSPASMASSEPCNLGHLKVIYGDEDWKCNDEVAIGKFSDQHSPEVTLTAVQVGIENAEYYTLVMVDPDVPSRALSKGYWLHWLVTNIKRDQIIEGYHGDGADVQTDYKSPSPPRNLGLHRYQFFLFGQPGKFSETEVTAPLQRSQFNLGGFESEYALEPVAGYQFRTKNV